LGKRRDFAFLRRGNERLNRAQAAEGECVRLLKGFDQLAGRPGSEIHRACPHSVERAFEIAAAVGECIRLPHAAKGVLHFGFTGREGEPVSQQPDHGNECDRNNAGADGEFGNQRRHRWLLTLIQDKRPRAHAPTGGLHQQSLYSLKL
jgi:hypothetical protein